LQQDNEKMNPFLNKIITGNSLEVLKEIPSRSVDMIFADPPYNLQLQNPLYRPDQSTVKGVFDDWDRFGSFADYDIFTRQWLQECQRILKPSGTLWTIGTYHNIFRVGKIMQDLGYWILNDIIWAKTNPMPNFRGTRFTNAHETLIWATPAKTGGFTFHYKSLKAANDDKQMQSIWYIPVVSGKERLKTAQGEKLHSTQKPEALLRRIILSSTQPGDIVLDPFVGTGTTTATAKKLGRQFIGIEKNPLYAEAARRRTEEAEPLAAELLDNPLDKKIPRVPFLHLVEAGWIKPGEKLYSPDGRHEAVVLANANLQLKNGSTGSIHQIAAKIMQKSAYNGWKFWNVRREKNILLDDLRRKYLQHLGIRLPD